jgi:hypothetical protein
MASDAWEVRMDSLVNQLARELSEAISVAVSQDARIEACREKARASGLELRVSLEAAIGFVPREGNAVMRPAPKKAGARGPLDMSANDRRFLKSLRISADENVEKEKEVE